MQLTTKWYLYSKRLIFKSSIQTKILLSLFLAVLQIQLSAQDKEPIDVSVAEKVWPIVEYQFENTIDNDSLELMFALVKGYCDGDIDCTINNYLQLKMNFEWEKFNLPVAIEITNQILYLSNKHHKLESKAEAYNDLFRYHSALGINKLGTIYLDSAIVVYQELDDDLRYILCKESKIKSFKNDENLEFIIQEMNALLEEAKTKNNPKLEFLLHRQIINDKVEAGLYEEVEMHLNKIQEFLNTDSINIFNTFDTLEYFRLKGAFYFSQEKWSEAEKYYIESLNYSIELPDKWREIHVLYKLSEINWNSNNKRIALSYLDKGLKESTEVNMHDLLSEGYGLKKQYAEEEQDYKTAYLSQQKLDAHIAELNNRADGFNIEQYYLQIEKDKLETEKKNSELELSVSNNRLRTAIIILISFLLMSASFFFAYMNAQKRKKQLEQQNELIKKQAEELTKLDVAKSRFFANASHEFRTPLSLMLGPINSLLKGGQVNTQQKELLEIADKNGEHLKQLVSDILDLSKSELGILELNKETVQLYPYLIESFEQFVVLAKQKNINYSYDTEIHADVLVNIDIQKCKQIITNILSNAFKYTPLGGTIRCRSFISDDIINISIADTGQGIHSDDLPHLFERYFQTLETNKIAEGGSGIGLALCKEYIGLMKGEIEVESTLGEGTVFSIKIPLEIIQNSNVGQASISNPNSVVKISKSQNVGNRPIHSIIENQSKPIILLVEDNLDLQKFYAIILKNQYEIIIANNGAEALDILFPKTFNPSNNSYKNIDLIISDLMMPIMNGYEFLEQVKSKDASRHIPTIVVTGKAEETDEIEVLRIGVDSYITKPFVEDDLLFQIRHLLSNQEERIHYHQEETSQENYTLSQEDMLWLKEFEKYIIENIKNDILDLAGLATHFAMSKSTLTRQLKKVTGMTPKKYLLEMRLEKARKLLDQNNKLSINQLASNVGFSDSRHFSRSFKNRFGKLPSEYNN